MLNFFDRRALVWLPLCVTLMKSFREFQIFLHVIPNRTDDEGPHNSPPSTQAFMRSSLQQQFPAHAGTTISVRSFASLRMTDSCVHRPGIISSSTPLKYSVSGIVGAPDDRALARIGATGGRNGGHRPARRQLFPRKRFRSRDANRKTSPAIRPSKEFKRAHVQFAITAQGVAQSALCFGERRRIENDQIVLRLCFFGRAQKLKNILLDPVDRQSIPLRIFLRRRRYFPCFLRPPLTSPRRPARKPARTRPGWRNNRAPAVPGVVARRFRSSAV